MVKSRRSRSGEQSWKAGGVDGVAGENGARVADAKVPNDDLAKHVAEVGGDREVASFVALLNRQPRPLAVDASTGDAAADRHHRVAMPVIGSAVAVFADGSRELGHRQ